MRRVFRIRLRIRRFTRRHPLVFAAIRSLTIFSAAFGGAYGFIAGSSAKNSGYDPNSFAIGASFLFALACAALATLSMRLRFLLPLLLLIPVALLASELDNLVKAALSQAQASEIAEIREKLSSVGALEVLRLHADGLSLSLGLDRLLDSHRPFLAKHRLRHRVREVRPRRESRRQCLRLRQELVGGQ